jgi:hypothetical protein
MQTLIAEWYRIEDESTRIGYQRVCGKLDAMMRRVRSPLENAGEQFNRFGGDRERGHVRADRLTSLPPQSWECERCRPGPVA